MLEADARKLKVGNNVFTRHIGPTGYVTVKRWTVNRQGTKKELSVGINEARGGKRVHSAITPVNLDHFFLTEAEAKEK